MKDIFQKDESIGILLNQLVIYANAAEDYIFQGHYDKETMLESDYLTETKKLSVLREEYNSHLYDILDNILHFAGSLTDYKGKAIIMCAFANTLNSIINGNNYSGFEDFKPRLNDDYRCLVKDLINLSIEEFDFDPDRYDTYDTISHVENAEHFILTLIRMLTTGLNFQRRHTNICSLFKEVMEVILHDFRLFFPTWLGGVL